MSRPETDLREWLAKNLDRKVSIQWVEPGKYGSSTGAADAILSVGKASVNLELKIWTETRNGIKCEMRPVQRRWHHVSMREGKRTAVLAQLNNRDTYILIRGDNLPLRDYAHHKDSGCKDGFLVHNVVFLDLTRLLFDESYGFWLDPYKVEDKL